MQLIDLGYNDYFKLEKQNSKFPNTPVARVIAEYKEAYKVKKESEFYEMSEQGKEKKIENLANSSKKQRIN